MQSAVPRESVFLQTKVPPEDFGAEVTKRVVLRSLQRLQTDYLDSVLLHEMRGRWQEAWRALEDMYESGKARAIGASNVNEKTLSALLRMRVKPHIVQNWMDPFHQDKKVREICKREGVQYQAYSTLGIWWQRFGGHWSNPVLVQPKLKAIAAAHGRDVAQVVLNWATRQDVAVIPASTKLARQRSNLNCLDFILSQQEIAEIAALDGRLGWYE
mmetsp:Transcript_11366/g.25245  ORF Transcript_11366/g.25245 Transcript_11366/m.25245 type:complete len:214 (-) Transcript_11366:29-670(-)